MQRYERWDGGSIPSEGAKRTKIVNFNAPIFNYIIGGYYYENLQ